MAIADAVAVTALATRASQSGATPAPTEEAKVLAHTLFKLGALQACGTWARLSPAAAASSCTRHESTDRPKALPQVAPASTPGRRPQAHISCPAHAGPHGWPSALPSRSRCQGRANAKAGVDIEGCCREGGLSSACGKSSTSLSLATSARLCFRQVRLGQGDDPDASAQARPPSYVHHRQTLI